MLPVGGFCAAPGLVGHHPPLAAAAAAFINIDRTSRDSMMICGAEARRSAPDNFRLRTTGTSSFTVMRTADRDYPRLPVYQLVHCRFGLQHPPPTRADSV